MNLNKSMFTGNITRDPELKYTGSGTAILGFGVAINNSYKDQSGEWVDNTCFVDVAVFGKGAESLNQRVAKGVHVFVEGSLRQDNWVDKTTGQNRSKHMIRADRVSLTQRGQSSPSNYQQPQQPQPSQAPPPMPSFNDDTPF